MVDNRRSNQFPLDSRDRGMNGREYSLPLNYQQEQPQRFLYPMDDCVNGYGAHKSYNHGFHGRSNNGVMSSPRTDFNGNLGDTVETPNVIARGSRETIDKIFDDLVSQVFKLMIDPVGHEVLQKLFEKCTDKQITRVLDVVIQQPIQFIRICGDSHGTNGNHVILFCFTHFFPSQNRYLLQVIAQNCYQVAIDQFGCCMLQHCIGKSCQEIRDPLIEEIITHSLSLCVNCYGNYVVQFVLELEDCHVAAALSRYLDGNYAQLFCDKYGSHAVQKCLTSRQFNSRRIVNELISDIDSLLVNPFGNYVIQTAWVVS
ncbi:hypothetical protein EUTSA_v10002283mg [Eutrema salsugineum]|uniref:PUM-HD domain-containing protein n=1 Tax=Eutrema salsugineum TaxID=72664 RepID=V4LHU5_EUTSA|nr:hypothetical protein EUTSA_v10002283mg [Eutrema salsugineum]